MRSRGRFTTRLLLAGLVSCSYDDRPAENTGRTQSAIVNGTASAPERDFVVLLAHRDDPRLPVGDCTGTLVAPRLVLTARHCLAATDVEVECDADGNAVVGGGIRGDFDPKTIRVYTGRKRPQGADPAARGVEIISDGATNLCNHDLALLLLDAPIAAPVAALRLDGDPTTAEILTTVGWGTTTDGPYPVERQERTNVRVTRLGPDAESPVLTPNELMYDQSTCEGDSGGPLVSTETNAVVGVVSRGGTCTESTNLGMKLRPFRDVFTRAFARAAAEPTLEARRPHDREGESGCSVAPLRPPNRALMMAGLFAGVMYLVRRGASSRWREMHRRTATEGATRARAFDAEPDP